MARTITSKGIAQIAPEAQARALRNITIKRMAQPKARREGRALGAEGERRALRQGSPHRVLCILPRRLPVNPLRRYLPDYELAAAETWTAALRLARHTAYDLYIVYAPLGWAEPAEICRRIRDFDAHTPLILYSAQPTAAERREAAAHRRSQAYVARCDDAHNLAGTAGQLIMLAELRSMEAMRLKVEALQTHVARRLTRLAAAGTGGVPTARSVARLKIEACRIFASAGGSRANFERLWPALYEGALKARA